MSSRNTNRVLAPAALERRRAKITAEIADLGLPLPGSLVERRTRCGNRGCRCHAEPPQLHGPYLSWIRKSAGRPITRKLTDEQEQRYRPWFDNSRRLRELVNELHALSIQAIEDAEGSNNRR